jgi:hypothetical protein
MAEVQPAIGLTARARRTTAVLAWLTQPGPGRRLLRIAIVLITWPRVAIGDLVRGYSPRGRFGDGWFWAWSGRPTDQRRRPG